MAKNKKLKWYYGKTAGHWYTTESSPYANDGMCIANVKYEGRGRGYRLHFDVSTKTFDFKKLSTAKKVAQMIYNG